MRISTTARSIGLSALVTTGSVALGQVYVPHEKVLSTADNGGFVPATGSLDGTQTWLKRFNSAFQGQPGTIDASGNIAFAATFTAGVGGVVGSVFDTSTPGHNQYAYMHAANGGPITIIARYNDPTLDNANCGGVGAVFTNRATNRVPISPNGFMWIGGYQIAGGTTTSADQNVIWGGQVGNFHNLVRANDVYLNLGNSQHRPNVTSASSQMARMNNLGQCAFLGQTKSNVGDTGAFNTNDTFIGVATSGTDAVAGQNGRVVKVVRTQSDDLVGGGSQWFYFFDPALNGSGTTFSVLGMVTGAGGAAGPGGVTGNDDWVAVLSTRTGNTFTHNVIAREGGPTGVGAIQYAVSPTIPGNPPFQSDQPGVPFATVADQGLNNGGRAIWLSYLKPGVGGVTTSNDSALMTYKNGVTSIVAREGDVMFGVGALAPLPIPTGGLRSAVSNFTLSNGDQVAWVGHFSVNGTTITLSNDEFLAVSSIDDGGGVTHTLVAREGDQIPAMPTGIHWSQPFPIRGDYVFTNLNFNAAGMIAFHARIDGPGVIRDNVNPLGDDFTYWLYTPASCGKFRLIARRSDVFDGLAISNIDMANEPNGEGSSTGFNDANWLSFYVDDGVADGALYRARICAADLSGVIDGEPDGGVDITDLLYFLGAFEAGSCAADVESGSNPGWGLPDGGVDINDLLFFLARFESGC